MTTLKQFNDSLGRVFKSALPEPVRTVDFNSHKRLVFDEFFGAGWQTFGYGKQLISLDDIISEDTPIGTPGVKTKGLREAFFKDYLDAALALETDPAFKEEMSDPDYRKIILNVQNRLINMVASRRAACKTLTIEEHDAQVKKDLEIAEKATAPWELLFPKPNITKFLKKTKSYFASLKLKKDEGKYKTALEFKDKIEKSYGNSFNIAGWAAAFSGVRKLFGKIPILLGPVPLKHVDYIEIARSGKILKFRATGTVFLARQEGGADAIKIEGLMYKTEFVTMFLLWGLFIYGQSKFREMEDIPGIQQLDITKIGEIRKLNDLLISDASREKPSYEFHQTFPFVNRHFIIPNCYIETISVEDKLPLKNVLQYSILLRTYEKPKEVSWVEKEGMRLYGISNKSTVAKVCEYSLNAAWRMLNASGWLLDEQEWKIGSAMKEGVLDTYYDIDWSTLNTITYLNLMGAAT